MTLNEIYSMNTLFWFYLIICFLAGTVWIPFVQLSATILKHRYRLQDFPAAAYASIILGVPIFLYPLVGLYTDRYGRRISICTSPF